MKKYILITASLIFYRVQGCVKRWQNRGRPPPRTESVDATSTPINRSLNRLYVFQGADFITAQALSFRPVTICHRIRQQSRQVCASQSGNTLLRLRILIFKFCQRAFGSTLVSSFCWSCACCCPFFCCPPPVSRC